MKILHYWWRKIGISPPLSAPVFSNVYYVAPDGNDANPGTITQAFLTLQKAQSAIKAGDTVYVRAASIK